LTATTLQAFHSDMWISFLTLRNTKLLEKLKFFQLVNKFISICGNWKCIILIAKSSTSHNPEPHTFSADHHTLILISNSASSFHLSLGLLSGLLPSVSLTGVWKKFLVYLMLATCPTNFILLDVVTHNIWWSVWIMDLLIMHCHPVSFFITSLRSKYSPQYCILRQLTY
jgi:hypothetical protein